jgi:hypothetical protein
MPTRFYIEERSDYNKAAEFGQAGPYEHITARAVTDAGEGHVDVMKPRDPSKGNGTLIFRLNPKQKRRPLKSDLLSQGYTFADLTWKDRATSLEGVHAVLNFLKVTGGPMLLGDQPRFIKRVLAEDAGEWLSQLKERSLNTGSKGQPLIDGTWPDNAPENAAK